MTAIAQGRVSAVYAKDGSNADAGDRLFASTAATRSRSRATVRFFRPLGVGDRGDDVLQLKQILAAVRVQPRSMNTVFTEQTRFALAQWQAQHHYPGATPVTPQTVTRLAQPGHGYSSATDVGRPHIGPRAARARPRRSGGPPCTGRAARRSAPT